MKGSIVNPKNKYLGVRHLLIWVIVAFSIILRLVQNLYNRSYWLDDAKLATQALGNNEFALKLFPLCGGILSVFLFSAIAKKKTEG